MTSGGRFEIQPKAFLIGHLAHVSILIFTQYQQSNGDIGNKADEIINR